MTTTPPEAPSGPPPQGPPNDTGPRVDRDQVRDLGRLRRSRIDRKVAGVAGGLGRHLDIDPLLLRVGFVVLVFFGGAGLILYLGCWLLVPEDGQVRARINLDERSRSVALLIVGVVAALALIGDSWGAFGFPWPLALVGLLALWLLTRNGSPGSPPPPAPPYPPSNPPSYPPSYQQPAPPYAGPAAPTAPDASAYEAQTHQAHPADPAYPAAPPPMTGYVPPPPRPVDPRKRGPILFWPTLALVALGEGLLGMADLAGASVADPAYPALAVAICAAMLLVGAFFGRAGGIILLGLASTVALAGATAADQWDGDQVTEAPTTAAAVDHRYWLGAGEQVIDLRQVTDLGALDGRTIDVEGGVGRIEVILPPGLTATVAADVDGPGNVTVFGEEHGGIDVRATATDGSSGDPRITLDAQLSVGQIEVHR